MNRRGPLSAPYDPEILNVLDSKVVSWSGKAWRLVLRGTDPLTSNSRGARWNPSDFEALYFSLDSRGAHAELDYLLARQPVPIHVERDLYRFEIRLSRVLDFRAGHGLEGFGVAPDALVREDWSATQALGYAAYKYLSCAGVLAPSARFAATNLVVFLGGMLGGDDLSAPVAIPNGPAGHP